MPLRLKGAKMRSKSMKRKKKVTKTRVGAKAKIAKIYPERDAADDEYGPFGGKDWFLP